MASLFKPTKPIPIPPDAEFVIKNDKRHVRIREDGKTVLYKVTKDGTKYLRPSDKWYGKYRDANDKLQKPPLSANKDAARTMLNDLLDEVEKERATGRKDPTRKHQKTPLVEHLNDWEASLRANGCTPEYIAQKLSRVSAVVNGCEWVFPADMNADSLEKFLADLYHQNDPNFRLCPIGKSSNRSK